MAVGLHPQQLLACRVCAQNDQLSAPTPPRPPLQDTGDTRETPAIDVCRGLMADGARVCVYDPQVEPQQVYQDLGTEKFEWDHPSPRSPPIAKTAIAIAPVRARA